MLLLRRRYTLTDEYDIALKIIQINFFWCREHLSVKSLHLKHFHPQQCESSLLIHVKCKTFYTQTGWLTMPASHNITALFLTYDGFNIFAFFFCPSVHLHGWSVASCSWTVRNVAIATFILWFMPWWYWIPYFYCVLCCSSSLAYW